MLYIVVESTKQVRFRVNLEGDITDIRKKERVRKDSFDMLMGALTIDWEKDETKPRPCDGLQQKLLCVHQSQARTSRYEQLRPRPTHT
jgi:hypothetical protein